MSTVTHLTGYQPYTRCLQTLRRLGFRWREFRYSEERRMWMIRNFEVGKDLGECLDNLRFLEKKRNETV